MPSLGLALSLLVGLSLGFFGGGGSILTVPLLVYVFGLEPKEAIASSLLIVGIASTGGVLTHARAGRVDLRTVIIFGGAGMAGAYAGGRASAYVHGTLLLLLFASMMLLTATAMWRGRRAAQQREAPHEPAPARLLAQGFAVGSFSVLVGAGGGFLIVPALVLWAGLPMTSAVGSSLAIIVLNTGAGFAGYASHVRVQPELVAAIAVAAVAGSWLGARIALRTSPEKLRRGFAGFIAVMATMIMVRESEAWIELAREAIPDSAPQLVFALIMLAIGLGAGRASARASERVAEHAYSDGGGI